MSEEKTVAEQLHDLLSGRLGDNWRVFLKPEIRADVFYWLVFLAERGIEAKRQDWLKHSGALGAEEAASLASWQIDLEMLLGKVEAALPKRKGGKK